MNPKYSASGAGETALTPIEFELRNDKARAVSVAGSFNDWSADSGAMTRENLDHWVRTIALPVGAYEYCFVVDGEWILDPGNQLSVDNPFGGRNSLFMVERPNEAVHRQNAEHETIAGAEQDLRDQMSNRAAKMCTEFAASEGDDSKAARTGLGPRGAAV